MKKSTKIILIGVGVLALAGVGYYFMAQRKKVQQGAAPQEGGGTAVAEKLASAIKRDPDVQQQKLANKRVKQSTRQAKLLKKGKITIDDLRKLQTV